MVTQRTSLSKRVADKARPRSNAVARRPAIATCVETLMKVQIAAQVGKAKVTVSIPVDLIIVALLLLV